MPGKFTKILVKGEKHPSFAFGPCQYIFVLASGRHGANPNYVMSGRLERGHGITGEILVSKKAHLTQRSDRSSPISARRERRQGKRQRRRERAPDNCAKYRPRSTRRP